MTTRTRSSCRQGLLPFQIVLPEGTAAPRPGSEASGSRPRTDTAPRPVLAQPARAPRRLVLAELPAPRRQQLALAPLPGPRPRAVEILGVCFAFGTFLAAAALL